MCTVELLRLRSLEFPIPSPSDGEFFAGVVCVCSFCAPHVGVAEAERVQFMQELVAMARRVHAEVRLPMIVAGTSGTLTSCWVGHALPTILLFPLLTCCFPHAVWFSATHVTEPPTTPLGPLISSVLQVRP